MSDALKAEAMRLALSHYAARRIPARNRDEVIESVNVAYAEWLRTNAIAIVEAAAVPLVAADAAAREKAEAHRAAGHIARNRLPDEAETPYAIVEPKSGKVDWSNADVLPDGWRYATQVEIDAHRAREHERQQRAKPLNHAWARDR